MSFGHLCDKPDFDELTLIAPRPGAPLWFLHIPKTAGSSFRRTMMARFPGSLHLDMWQDGPNPHRTEPETVVAEFTRSGAFASKLFCATHVPFRYWTLLATQPDTKLITFLREPTARLISDYRYQGTERHPRYQEFRAKFPDFNRFFRDKSAINRMTKHLAAFANEPVDAIIDRLETDFALVGTQEEYDLCLRLLLAGLGLTTEAHDRKMNVTDESATAIALGDDILAEIRQLNHAATTLFVHFARRIAAAKPALEAMLAQHEIPAGGEV